MPVNSKLATRCNNFRMILSNAFLGVLNAQKLWLNLSTQPCNMVSSIHWISPVSLTCLTCGCLSRKLHILGLKKNVCSIRSKVKNGNLAKIYAGKQIYVVFCLFFFHCSYDKRALQSSTNISKLDDPMFHNLDFIMQYVCAPATSAVEHLDKNLWKDWDYRLRNRLKFSIMHSIMLDILQVFLKHPLNAYFSPSPRKTARAFLFVSTRRWPSSL